MIDYRVSTKLNDIKVKSKLDIKVYYINSLKELKKLIKPYSTIKNAYMVLRDGKTPTTILCFFYDKREKKENRKYLPVCIDPFGFEFEFDFPSTFKKLVDIRNG